MEKADSSKPAYPGYPRYVVLAFPKSGTKTINKVFSALGYKVFDVMQVPDYAVQFNKFGREEIEFAELAKVWEENQYDAIIEPAGIYWTYMVDQWPKTKFIHVTRDEESWKKSFTDFFTAALKPKDSLVHVLTRNPCISPTHNEVVKCIDGYIKNLVGIDSYFHDHSTFENGYPWPRFLTRMFRQFHADVILHAPKDRTLFNYQVKDGWPKLREFLEIEGDTNDTFPHENKGGDVDTFVSTLWDKSKYQEGYEQDLKEYLEKYGITMLTNKE